MRQSAVFRCVSLIAGLLACIPLCVYHDDEVNGRRQATGNRLYKLLHDVPYPGRPLSSFAWRELMGANTMLAGNHYAILRYDNAARVVGIDPIPNPHGVEVRRLANGTNLYVCKLLDGSTEVVPQDEMLHFHGPGFDGIKGLSRIQFFARDAVSLSSVFEEQTGRLHENSARPSGMVTVPSTIKPDGLRRMEASFNERSAGRANAGRVLFADKDSVFTPFQLTAEDLNTLEARRFQIADICRFFGVPPHLLGESDGTSAWGTGIEQNTLGFLRFSLEPELQRIEHELNMKLFANGPYFAAFDRDALLTMDAKTAAEVSQTEINSGTLTPNEQRRKKGRPSLGPIGDIALVNSTMLSLERAVTAPPPPPKPTKEPANAPANP
jgi:HK97 family phage portal protein